MTSLRQNTGSQTCDAAACGVALSSSLHVSQVSATGRQPAIGRQRHRSRAKQNRRGNLTRLVNTSARDHGGGVLRFFPNRADFPIEVHGRPTCKGAKAQKNQANNSPHSPIQTPRADHSSPLRFLFAPLRFFVRFSVSIRTHQKTPTKAEAKDTHRVMDHPGRSRRHTGTTEFVVAETPGQSARS